MREILFRGKRIYKNEWVYGNLVIDNRGELHIVRPEDVVQDGHHIHDDSDLPMFFEQETFGQYAGMKDKNGQRIFEGDIVRDMSGVVYPVVYSGTGFYLRYDPPHGHGFHYDLLPLCNYWHVHGAVIEIIGNIHDNPERLERGEADG